MSLSPTADSPGDIEGYETGWIALHRMLREGGSLSGREPHCVFLNTGLGGGQMRFADVSAVSGLDLPDDGRAVARLDWDRDGDLDLVFTSRQAPRVRVMRNDQESGNDWVAFRLRGESCNRDAIGARVEVHAADGQVRVESLRAGEGYLGQSSKWVHFGLGPGAGIERVVVRWPDRTRSSFEGVRPNARWELVQGRPAPAPWTPPPAAAALAPSTPQAEEPTARARVVLAARVPLPLLSFTDAAGNDAGQALAGATAGGPVLLVLWASWCPPCIEELGELARREQELGRTGVTLVAVGADEPEHRAAAAELLTSLDWPYLGVFADRTGLEVLDTLQQALVDRRHRLPLPTSFLIDAEGRLAVVYRGRLDVAAFIGDASKLRATPEEIRSAAVPFPGVWRAALPAADLGLIETRLDERGLERAAREYGLHRIETETRSRAEMLNEFGLVRARQGDLDGALSNFRGAAAQDPGLFDAWTNLGSALHQTGQLQEAIGAYERALRLDPRHTATIYNLGLAYFVAGEAGAAEQQHALLQVLDPETAGELREELDRLSRRGD